jgi:indolepyruvate decarboxylase
LIVACSCNQADALLLLGVILSDTNFARSQRRLDPRRTMLAFDRARPLGAGESSL